MKLDKDLVSQQASETAANVAPFGHVSLRAGLVKPSLMERQENNDRRLPIGAYQQNVWPPN